MLADDEKRMFPDHNDEKFKSFYNAIRSGNIKQLDGLINKWSGNRSNDDFKKLADIISQAYEELKLKNVLLTEDVDIFVLNKLINFRFSGKPVKKENQINRIANTNKRINLVLENITSLKTDYTHSKKADGELLFRLKFIAQNIHILKRQLKSTYDKLPWEEIEFCLIGFVSSHAKKLKIDLFSRATLNTNKLLKYLENFRNLIQSTKIIASSGNHDISNLKREKVIKEIIDHNPQFEELYMDFQRIRDMYSLQKISNYIKLALSVDAKTREGKLIVMRCLLIISEHFKNTLESPKMSTAMSELVLNTLPDKTRRKIKDLRNLLAHPHKVYSKTEVEENMDIDLLISFQNDVKRMNDLISYILRKNKIEVIKTLMKKIVNCESSEDIMETCETIAMVKSNKKIKNGIKFIGYKEPEDLVYNTTNYEENLFKITEYMIYCMKINWSNLKNNIRVIVCTLSSNNLNTRVNENIDKNNIKDAKLFAKKNFDYTNNQMKFRDLTQMLKLLLRIIVNNYVGSYNHSAQRETNKNVRSLSEQEFKDFETAVRYLEPLIQRYIKMISDLFFETQFDAMGRINRLSFVFGFIKAFETSESELFAEPKYDLIGFTPESMKTPTYFGVRKFESEQSELRSMLEKKKLSDKLFENISSYKKDKKFQAVVEMLVLNIMSVLGRSKFLRNNLFLFDEHAPLLTGKSLRNHLAHDNLLLDIFSTDPSVAIFLNAGILSTENEELCKKKIFKLVKDDPTKLEDKYERNLEIITDQEEMFEALKEGNRAEFQKLLNNGVDINARCINSWTALHFAARGTDLELVRYIIGRKVSVNVKDVEGRTPLHIAAACGRKPIVKFFIREAEMEVDDTDNNHKTPLHFAAQNGHTDTVTILLQYNANADCRDVLELSPLHYAVKNHFIDVCKILLEETENVDTKELINGFTCLHTAAEKGYMDIITLLLENGANVNIKNNQLETPLHLAALNGHLNIVHALIVKGVDIDSTMADNWAPLQYALRNGHNQIVYTLHRVGTNPNHWSQIKFYDVVRTVEKAIERNLPETFDMQYYIGNIFFFQRKWYPAFKSYVGIFHQRLNALGKNHPIVKDIYSKIEMININYYIFESNKNPRISQNIQDIFLCVAAAYGDLEDVRSLLRYGANVNTEDGDERTPLYYAVSKGHVAIVKILIENDADVSYVTNEKVTPLHTAVSKGYVEIVELLLHTSYGKWNLINSKTPTLRDTPLHIAAKGGYYEIVKCLLKHGAYYNRRNIEGETPFDCSINRNISHVLWLIEKMFEEVYGGSIGIRREIIYTYQLRIVKQDVFLAITRACHVDSGETIIDVATRILRSCTSTGPVYNSNGQFILNFHNEAAFKLLGIYNNRSPFHQRIDRFAHTKTSNNYVRLSSFPWRTISYIGLALSFFVVPNIFCIIISIGFLWWLCTKLP